MLGACQVGEGVWGKPPSHIGWWIRWRVGVQQDQPFPPHPLDRHLRELREGERPEDQAETEESWQGLARKTPDKACVSWGSPGCPAGGPGTQQPPLLGRWLQRGVGAG